LANKKKACRNCKEYVDVDSGIQIRAGFFCEVDCIAKHGANKQIKQRENEQKRAKVERKKVFECNDLPKQKKITQDVFNKMRRLEEFLWFQERGLDPVCISCGKPLGNDQWACGHFKTRGAQGGLRFDRMNAFLQHNRRCNKALGGDIEGTKTTRGYKVGLVERFGEQRGNEIIEYCESNTQIVKWTGEDLIKMRKEFNKKIRELELLLH
jgi:hypothetical protein